MLLPPVEQTAYKFNVICVLMGAWIGALIVGYHCMLSYPGEIAVQHSTWPENAQFEAKEGHWTVVMFAHPRCPCTRASLVELNKVLKASAVPLDAYVVFYRPENSSPEWAQTDLWKQAAAIPGVCVFDDEAGTLAKRFQAKCSGVVYVYGPLKRLRYFGGVTGSRGHVGENIGQLEVQTLLTPEKNQEHLIQRNPTTCSVFGCPLFPPASATAPRELNERSSK